MHLKDRHFAGWSHFSLYLVRKAEHIGEIESLLIKIANPKGNRKIPKGAHGGAMLSLLREMLKQKHKEELDEIFGRNKRRRLIVGKSNKYKALAGMVKTKTALFRTYKGKGYKAFLHPDGIIKIGKQRFNTPTGAAKTIVTEHAVNGWTFWYIETPGGEWVRLSEYR